jgi:Protein of unknown function (DUF3180)
MKPTRIRDQLVVVAVTALLVLLLLLTVYGQLPQVPTYAPVSLVFLAVAEGVCASSIKARLAGRPGTRPIERLAVARLAALAKASGLAGALMAGAYLGMLAYTLQHLDRRVSSHDAVASGFGLGAAFLLGYAALLLERACRRPDVPPEDDYRANQPPQEWDPLRDLHGGGGRPPTP